MPRSQCPRADRGLVHRIKAGGFAAVVCPGRLDTAINADQRINNPGDLRAVATPFK
jgi:hypothetical protein